MNKAKKIITGIVVGVLIAGAVAGTVYLLNKCSKPQQSQTTAQETYAETTAAETTAISVETTAETLEEKVGMTINSGAFNIQVFGQSKLSKEKIMEILVDIAGKYDILAIQEVRDKEGVVIPTYLDMINKEYGGVYDVVASEPLGRTSSKENYAFIYNTQKIGIVNSFVYEDKNDDFEREPFIVNARYGNSDATFIVIHTKPDDAPEEIDNLVNVIAYADARNGEDSDIIVKGDFNMGSPYFALSRYTELLNQDKYVALITDDMKTTLSGKPLDRAFMTISMLEDYVSGSAGAYEYFLDKEIAQIMLENNIENKDVSDHLPLVYQLEEGRDSDLGF